MIFTSNNVINLGVVEMWCIYATNAVVIVTCTIITAMLLALVASPAMARRVYVVVQSHHSHNHL